METRFMSRAPSSEEYEQCLQRLPDPSNCSQDTWRIVLFSGESASIDPRKETQHYHHAIFQFKRTCSPEGNWTWVVIEPPR